MVQEAKAYEAVVELDLTRFRSIQAGEHAKSVLDRQVYFRTYFPLGHEPDAMTSLLQSLNVSTARGTTHIRNLREDPQRPGFVDPRSLEADMERYIGWYAKAQEQWPGVVHAMAHATRLPWMEGFAESDRHQDEHSYRVHADLIKMWYDHLKQADVSIPTWYSSWNEPNWQFSGTELGLYTRTIAELLAEHHPEVNVAGPCPAWPYPQRGGGSIGWGRWESQEKAFIDVAGDVVAGYDFHFYSKGDWANDTPPIASSPSLYESQREFVGNVWEHGRLESFLDLVAAYHQYRWQEELKPVIVSEFGRQSIQHQFGPWENDFKSWIFMITVTNMWMRFMERPEVVLTVPFILHDQSHSQRGMALINDQGMTRFVDFYDFFSDLKGVRVPAQVLGSAVSESRDLLVNGFIDGDVVYVLLHNRQGFPQGDTAYISLAPKVDEQVVQQEIKRMRWEGEVPDPHDDPDPDGVLRIDTEYLPLDSLTRIPMQGEETVIIRLALAEAPVVEQVVQQVSYYGEQTVVPITPDRWQDFSIDIPATGDDLVAAQLGLGVYRDRGFSENPEVLLNGQPLTEFDLTFSDGIKEFQTVQMISIPPGTVTSGSNQLQVRFPQSASGGQGRIVASKIVVSREVTAEDLFSYQDMVLPGSFGLIEPDVHTMVDPKHHWFAWSQARGADMYRLVIGTDALFETIIAEETVSDLGTSVPVLGYGQAYYVKVQAVSHAELANMGISRWNDQGAHRFTTISAPKIPDEVGVTVVERLDGVKLTWALSDYVNEYTVSRRQNDADEFLPIVRGLPPNATGFLDQTAVSGQQYQYLVTAINDAGSADGPPSDWLLVQGSKVLHELDFADGVAPGWSRTGAWSFPTGENIGRLRAVFPQVMGTLAIRQALPDEFVMETRFRVNLLQDASMATLRITANTAGRSQYQLIYWNSRQLLELNKRTDDGSKRLDATVFGLQRQRWYQLRLELVGGQIRVYIDEQLVLTVVDEHPLSGGSFEVFATNMEIEFERLTIVGIDE